MLTHVYLPTCGAVSTKSFRQLHGLPRHAILFVTGEHRVHSPDPIMAGNMSHHTSESRASWIHGSVVFAASTAGCVNIFGISECGGFSFFLLFLLLCLACSHERFSSVLHPRRGSIACLWALQLCSIGLALQSGFVQGVETWVFRRVRRHQNGGYGRRKAGGKRKRDWCCAGATR